MFKLILMWAITILFIGCIESPKNKNKSPNLTGNRDNQNEPLPEPIPSPEPVPNRPLPKCEVICDNSQELFKETDQFSYLSFVNFGFRGIGRCRGHAIITQNLAKLAFFDHSDRSCVKSAYDSQCASNALEQIKNILSYKAEKIIGFPDILTMSEHPKIKAYLKMRVRSISHKYSARTVVPENPQSDNQFTNIFYELVARVERNHEPYIGIKGGAVGDHALLAYDYKRTAYGDTLCVRDSNFIPPNGLECRSIIYHQNGEIYYKRADLDPTKLFIFNLMTDENIRVEKYRVAQKKYCIKLNHLRNNCTL